MKIHFYLVLISLFAFPVHAGQATIVETDTEIIVEYSGSEEDRQVTVSQREEQENKLAQEKEKEERKNASAARRTETRKAIEQEE